MYKLYEELANGKTKLIGTFKTRRMAEDMMEDGKKYELVKVDKRK